MSCYSPTTARTAPSQHPIRLRQQRAAFSDDGHLAFYGGTAAAAAAARPTRRRPTTPVVASASGTSSRRARVLQQVADVEATLLRLEQVQPLASSPLPQHFASTRRARAPSSSSSSESSSESSESEGEGEHTVAAQLRRRLAAQQELLRAAHQLDPHTVASNILAAPPTAAAAPPLQPPAADAAAAGMSSRTVVRVCTGKKCSQAGSAAVLAQLSGMPGVVAQPTKCLKQCRRCVAVEMASGSGGRCAADALYTGVNAANVAGVLAMHRSNTAQCAPACP